jgi:hypothetical protein
MAVQYCGNLRATEDFTRGRVILMTNIMNDVRMQSDEVQAHINGRIPDNLAARGENSLQCE